METGSLTRPAVVRWMNTWARDYDNPTQLAEGCTAALELYEDDQATIPELVYEIALAYFPETSPTPPAGAEAPVALDKKDGEAESQTDSPTQKE